jgi:CDP-diacylglycerol--serine O-phosphatidyltransferase
VPFYSFKDINLKKSVPFWAVLAIVAALTVIATKPAMVLFLLVVAYSVSGYVHWALGRRPRRIV